MKTHYVNICMLYMCWKRKRLINMLYIIIYIFVMTWINWINLNPCINSSFNLAGDKERCCSIFFGRVEEDPFLLHQLGNNSRATILALTNFDSERNLTMTIFKIIIQTYVKKILLFLRADYYLYINYYFR